MFEKMSPREVDSKARDIATRAAEALGDPEQGERAINDPEVAAVIASWEQDAITSKEEMLKAITEGRDMDLPLKTQRYIASRADGRDRMIAILKESIDRIKGDSSRNHLSQQLPNAAAEITLGRPVTSGDTDVSILGKAKAYFRKQTRE